MSSQYCTRLHALLLGEGAPKGKLFMSDSTWKYLPMTGFSWDHGGWDKWKLPGFLGYIWDTSKTVRQIKGSKCPTEVNCWPICLDETIPYLTVRIQNWHDDGGIVVQL